MFTLMIFALVVGLTNSPNTVTVELEGGDLYNVSQECADVVIASGYTKDIDFHRYVTGTPEYVDACF